MPAFARSPISFRFPMVMAAALTAVACGDVLPSGKAAGSTDGDPPPVADALPRPTSDAIPDTGLPPGMSPRRLATPN
jgi:hypothetical protein